MSTPRTKRQFTGAQRQITTYFTPSHPSSASPPQQKPVLPNAIQSDLLSVGMRIRKSVPEGYKTGTRHSAFKLWDERDAGGAPLPHAARARRGGAGAGELVPFCGVHRVGGYAVQPALPADDDDDGMPGLTSSQGSLESLEFEVENERKRGFVDDEDEDAWGGGVMTVGAAGNRVIALPRGRRKGVPVGGGQENVSTEDFDDADFLDERVFGGDHGMSGV